MVIGIRQRIMIGFGSVLAVIIISSLLTMAQIGRLGRTPGVILKENYRSVIACQEMKEAIERMDSGVLFTLAGRGPEGIGLVRQNSDKFRKALDTEMNNITIPGEHEKAVLIAAGFEKYERALSSVTDGSLPMKERQDAYFSTLSPIFSGIKGTAQEILAMNQQNMMAAGTDAVRIAQSASQKILSGIFLSACIAVVFIFLAQKWILRPVKRLIESTKEIGRGNFDLVLETGANDEIGILSRSFNEMTAALRQVRGDDRVILMRGIRATEEVFKVLPEAVAVLDREGRVQISTESAQRVFGFKRGIQASSLGYEWLPPLIQQAALEERPVEIRPKNEMIQKFVDNRELFFQPMVIPIPLDPDRSELSGYALLVRDVTQVHEQRELKRGVLSTVLHQLRTPLTSLHLSVCTLLEERVGKLNGKQAELLGTAKDDSERLVVILDDLLSLHRIEADSSHVSPKPVSPMSLVAAAIESFSSEAEEKRVALVNDFREDLPEVMADSEKIGHVFDNLLSNALRHTPAGGTVRINAKAEPDFLRFTVRDTGEGISAEYLDKVFQPFFRIPSDEKKPGSGLGLSIVKEIVEAHGGSVSAESQPGKGSAFHFTLRFFVG